MPTKDKNWSVYAADIAADQQREVEANAAIDRQLVTRSQSLPKRSVINVTPYASPTITPNSTRVKGR